MGLGLSLAESLTIGLATSAVVTKVSATAPGGSSSSSSPPPAQQSLLSDEPLGKRAANESIVNKVAELRSRKARLLLELETVQLGLHEDPGRHADAISGSSSSPKDCKDESSWCPEWARSGDCEENEMVASKCRLSCSRCSGPVALAVCKDEDADQCPVWAAKGDCETNPWMHGHCPKSCRTCRGECVDSSHSCAEWANGGECQKNPTWMRAHCPESCQQCSHRACEDKDSRCHTWSKQGACSGSNADWMRSNCRSACGMCSGSGGGTCRRLIRQICVQNLGGFALEFELTSAGLDLHRSGARTDLYSNPFRRCVDGAMLHAHHHDRLGCRVDIAAGRAGVPCEGSGTSLCFDASSTDQAEFICRGTTLAPECSFSRIAPVESNLVAAGDCCTLDSTRGCSACEFGDEYAMHCVTTRKCKDSLFQRPGACCDVTSNSCEFGSEPATSGRCPSMKQCKDAPDYYSSDIAGVKRLPSVIDSTAMHARLRNVLHFGSNAAVVMAAEVPVRSSKAQKFPAILFVTAWGQALNSYAGDMKLLAQRGYYCFVLLAPGFKDQMGAVDLSGPTTVSIVQRTLDWIEDQLGSRLAKTPDGRPAIGMSGLSYGGLITQVAAARDSRIRAIVVECGTFELQYQLV
eukprot:TRINITY_DN18738_c0_g1_i2.p1 TRINITY_DN18738_c0_g1~~TRINITY_DN18738_c0_g1_i2.p1  ORF type:complete len:634 (-),score=84.83 TRINITY_DN18738_c0_g1_i2:1598-3499(-)